jgi:hypothetical protein
VAWSYSGNPEKSLKDQVRFLCGDTRPDDPLLQDEEIKFLIKQCNNSPYGSAIRCCEAIAVHFARLCDESVGQVRLSLSQKVEAYRKMKEDLRQRMATEDMTPYAGGISQTDHNMAVKDEDRIPPDFTKHQMENEQIAPWTQHAKDDTGGGGGE